MSFLLWKSFRNPTAPRYTNRKGSHFISFIHSWKVIRTQTLDVQDADSNIEKLSAAAVSNQWCTSADDWGGEDGGMTASDWSTEADNWSSEKFSAKVTGTTSGDANAPSEQQSSNSVTCCEDIVGGMEGLATDDYSQYATAEIDVETAKNVVVEDILLPAEASWREKPREVPCEGELVFKAFYISAYEECSSGNTNSSHIKCLLSEYEKWEGKGVQQLLECVR